jgi:phosphoglycerate dehydrogenase-like enzyme
MVSSMRIGGGACAILIGAFLAVMPVQAQQNEFGPPGPPVSTPIPDDDMAAVAKRLGLVESAKPARELIPNWRKPKKVVVFLDNNTNRLAWFQKVAPGVELVGVHSRAEAATAIVGADAQIGNSCSRPLITAGANTLKFFHDYHAGVDGCFSGEVLPQLKSGAVVVANTQRVFGPSVGYHAIAMMVTLSRSLDLYVQMKEKKRFIPNVISDDRMWILEGRTLLVAGLGGIGSDIARLGHALGMHVIATNRTIPATIPDYVDHVGLPDELPVLIAKADVVVSALPLTPDTAGLFNAAMFNRMKKGALFINIARGGEVVQPDLIAALKSGQLGGAGLDVFDPDRVPDNDPIFDAPNLIMTPHVGGHALDAGSGLWGPYTWDVARENLRRYVNGDKLYSVVDPAKGY